MSIFKKKVKVEQEYVECDFCTRNELFEKITQRKSLYIMKCAACGADMCPEHREKISDYDFLCPVCDRVWKVLELFDKVKGK